MSAPFDKCHPIQFKLIKTLQIH